VCFPYLPLAGTSQLSEHPSYLLFSTGSPFLFNWIKIQFEVNKITGNVLVKNNRYIDSPYKDLDGAQLVGGSAPNYEHYTSTYTHFWRYHWCNVLFSWNGPTNTMQLYYWHPAHGWLDAETTGALWNDGSSATIMNTGSTVGHNSNASEIWVSSFGIDDGFIDFSNSDNRDMFFDPITGRAVAIDTSGWTEWGAQPLVWSPDGDLTNHQGSMASWTYPATEPAVAPIGCNERYEYVN
jgi:hypothetical protein